MTTNAELAVLSLVQEQPRHGYEIEQVIQDRGMRDWTDIGFSSIYYILGKLEKQGLVQGHMQDAEGRGPARKVYHLTRQGRSAMHEAVLQTLRTPDQRPSPLQLALANLFIIPPNEALAALRHHRDELGQRIDYVENREQAVQPRHLYVQGMFDHALCLLRAEREWIDGFVQQLEAYHHMKTDFKKELNALYNPSRRDFSTVQVPPMRFLMIDGHGDPNTSQEYADAVAALYGLAYAIKFASKNELDHDYVVPPLEGLWWVGDGSDEAMAAFGMEDKSNWNWTMMIMLPDWISDQMVGEAKTATATKKDLPALADIRVQTYEEGLAVQIMHVGPYAAEAPTIAAMHRYIQDHGYAPNGKHHEVYISDPRRTASEKLKTVLRQPVRPL